MARKKSVTNASAPEERPLEAANETATTTESTIAPVSSSYCLPDKADMVIARLEPTGEQLLYTMCDTSGNLVFFATDDSNLNTLKTVLRDASGRTVVVLKNERSNSSSGSSSWRAFREDSEQEREESDSNLLFTIVHSNNKFNSSLNITIPNHKGDVSQPRFTARTKRFGRSFAVVLRDDNNRHHRMRIAKAQRRTTCFSLPCCNFDSKNQSRIEISARADRAFIASIFVLADQARRRRRSSSHDAAESAGPPIALGIPARTLYNRESKLHQLAAADQQRQHAPDQWVSPSEEAFQAYSAYQQMYIHGHESNNSDKRTHQLAASAEERRQPGTHQLAASADERRQPGPHRRMSASEAAFQEYNAYHQMYISGHDTRL